MRKSQHKLCPWAGWHCGWLKPILGKLQMCHLEHGSWDIYSPFPCVIVEGSSWVLTPAVLTWPALPRLRLETVDRGPLSRKESGRYSTICPTGLPQNARGKTIIVIHLWVPKIPRSLFNSSPLIKVSQVPSSQDSSMSPDWVLPVHSVQPWNQLISQISLWLGLSCPALKWETIFPEMNTDEAAKHGCRKWAQVFHSHLRGYEVGPWGFDSHS